MRQLSGRAGIFLPYRDAIVRHKVTLAFYIVVRYIGLGRSQWRRDRDCDKDQLAPDESAMLSSPPREIADSDDNCRILRSEIVSQPRFGVPAAVLETGTRS